MLPSSSRPIFSRRPLAGLRALLLATISLLLMVFDHEHHPFPAMIRNIMSCAVVPVHYAIALPIHLYEQSRGFWEDQHELWSENQDLRAQLLAMQVSQQQYLGLVHENDELRALLSAKSRLAHRVMPAEMLAINPDPTVHEVFLDRGSVHGVYVGQAVLDASGVMGQVMSVGPLTSRVLLIGDLRSHVPVQVARNGVRALVAGLGQWERLRLIHVPETTDVRVGDVLVTSGLDLLYPPGYPVGRVQKVERSKTDVFADIDVLPSAELGRSRYVLLVWPSQAAEQQQVKIMLQDIQHVRFGEVPDKRRMSVFSPTISPFHDNMIKGR